MKKITSVILSVLVLGLALTVTGCSKSGKTTTVEIWHTYNGSQKEFLEKAVEQFNASQNKYTVVALAQERNGFADAVYQAVANKVGPSIIFDYGSTAVDYIEEGLAVDIRKYIEEDEKKGDTTMKDIIASLPEAMKTDVMGFADGGIYYLPGCTTGPVLFYNKTIFDEMGLNPPKDWNELAEISKKIYEEKGIAGFHSDGLVDNIQALIMQNNLGYIDVPAKKVTFCTPKLAEIFDWYAENCKMGYFEFNTIGQYASEDLANGEIASFSGSCVNDQYITMLNGAELGMAPWIAASNGTSFYTGWNRGPVLLSRNEKVNRGTYEFVKFFLSPEMNGGWAKANSAIAPYGTTEKNPEYQSYINNLPATSALPCVKANLSASGSFPNVPGAAQLRGLLVEYLNNVVDGKLSSSEAVKKLEEECNKALQG